MESGRGKENEREERKQMWLVPRNTGDPLEKGDETEIYVEQSDENRIGCWLAETRKWHDAAMRMES